MRIKIPTPLVDIIYTTINTDAVFALAPEQIKQKLFSKLLELWLFIFNKQSSNTEALVNNYYVGIHNNELNKFRIYYNNKDFGYRYLIELLIESKLIDININENGKEIYSTDNKFSKSYRILFNFTTNKNTTEIDIDFTKIFLNTKDKQFWITKYPQYAHLIEDCYRTKIDLNEYVDFLYENEGIKLKPTIKNGFLKERTLDSIRIIDYINRAVKINLQNIWFGISEQGRFYNSIASLSSIATPYILLDNKHIESIDISNCQPLLLASIINNNLYKKDVEEGLLYEKLTKQMGLEWNKENKNIVKLKVMLKFFDDKKILKGKFYNAFNTLYPGFIEELNILKENNKIAHITHKLESIIMVDGVGSLNISKLLKHDEVMVYSENVYFVKRYIKNKIKEQYNLNIGE